MPILSVHLLGKFTAYTAPAVMPAGLEVRKVQELLCYLLVHRSQPQHRETLAGTLWGETTAVQSRANLRKTLWQLHTAIEPCVEAGPPNLIDIQGEWLQIHPDADLWLDIELLESAYAMSKGQRGEELSAAVAAVLEDAVKLYHSDLLDGWYQDWCLFERERLQSMYLSLLDKLMGYCEFYVDYEKGIAYGADALRYDQTREQTHRRLMRLHFLAGDRPAALRQYERCRAILHESMSIEPAEQTIVLQEQIRRNTLNVAPNSVVVAAAQHELVDLRAMLQNLQATLSTNEAHVRKYLEAVEQLLSKRH